MCSARIRCPLTDSAAAYPSVNHSWIFSVLAHTGLPDFLCRFLRSIFWDNIKHVEFAGAERRQFLMARGVRQGCPASGFLFAMAFDPIFRCLQESIIPRNLDNLEFLQPAQCAYADDLAVASSLFWRVDVCTGTCIPFCGLHHWPQFELLQMLVGSVWH